MSSDQNQSDHLLLAAAGLFALIVACIWISFSDEFASFALMTARLTVGVLDFLSNSGAAGQTIAKHLFPSEFAQPDTIEKFKLSIYQANPKEMEFDAFTAVLTFLTLIAVQVEFKTKTLLFNTPITISNLKYHHNFFTIYLYYQ